MPTAARHRSVIPAVVLAVAGAAAGGCTGGHPAAGTPSATGPSASGSSAGGSSTGGTGGSAGAGAGASRSPGGSGGAGGSGPATASPPPPAPVPLTGLPYVPAGFTLPPGSVVQSQDVVGARTEVVLTAPSVAVAVAYLRAELARLGYAQLLVRRSGTATAYAYRHAGSVLSVSGGTAAGLQVTAVVFQQP